MTGPLLTSPVVGAAVTPAQGVPSQVSPGLPINNYLQSNALAPGWASGAPAPALPVQTVPRPVTQPWPADAIARAPFRVWTSGSVPQDDGVTAYGSPPLFDAPSTSNARTDSNNQVPRTEARYAGIAKSSPESENGLIPVAPSRPQFSSLEPYREPSTERSVARRHRCVGAFWEAKRTRRDAG